LVSDAGTPLVSDPGGRLLAAALAAGHEVSPVPGPSAALAALLVSGLAPTPFAFLGFLPRRPGARREALTRWRGRPETLVLFESPRRVGATAREAAELLGDRPACVARELTKLHEEVVRGPAHEVAERFAAGARGEIVLVIGPGAQGAADEDKAREAVEALVEAGAKRRAAAKVVSGLTGVPANQLYRD
jgi:16S rRNA (cytidine1402-2'-O)-methyltransferase